MRQILTYMKHTILLVGLAALWAACSHPLESMPDLQTNIDKFTKTFGLKNVECAGFVPGPVAECLGTKKGIPYKFSCNTNSCTVEMN